MDTFTECPSCSNNTVGDTIYQCTACGRIGCSACANPDDELGVCYCGAEAAPGERLFEVIGHIEDEEEDSESEDTKDEDVSDDEEDSDEDED